MAGKGAAGMTRLGVVSNPRSGRNRRRGLGVPPDLAARHGACHAVPGAAAELTQVLAGFARDGVETIVVDGGDGTVRAVIQAALAEPGFARPPRFAVLRSGTTNMIAGDVGIDGDPATAFARLIASDAGATVVRRPLLAVETGHGTELGFFLGAGAIVWGTRFTRRHLERGRLASGIGTALGVTATIGRLAVGLGGPLAAGAAMTVGYDGAAPASGTRLLLLVTTLGRLLLGLSPFWGTESKPLRVLDVAAPPRRFACALPALARGRPRAWMAGAGYRSLNAERIALALEDEVLIDGEWCRPARGDTLAISAGPEIAFLRP
jgi:hypothetical protein